MEWDGDPTYELIRTPRLPRGRVRRPSRSCPSPQGNPERPPKGELLMVADLYGDFRDELVVLVPERQGGSR